MFPFTRPLMVVVAAALASLAGGALRADVLTLANGDKLKGKLVSNADGLLTFKSDILGVISVPAAKATVTVDPPPRAAAPAAAVAPTATVAATTPAASTTTSEAKPHKKRKIRLTPFPALLDPRSAASDPGKVTKADDTGWFNSIGFGLISQSGRTTGLNIDLSAENDLRTPLTDTRFLNRYTYGKTEGIQSADSLSSNLRFRRALTRRLFFQSNTRYTRDAITLTQCDAEQGFGFGMNLKSTKAFMLSAGSDAAVRYRSYYPLDANTPAAPRDLSCVLNVFQDMTLKFNQRFMITQNFNAMVAPTNDSDYKVNFNAGITSKLTDTFNITARAELEYDRTLLPDLRYNQRITTSLGYVF